MTAVLPISKGALEAPLLFLGAALAAWASVVASPAIWAVSLACLATVLWRHWTSRWALTPLGLSVAAYAAWTFFHTALISRPYNPAGLFDPVFLLAGFAIGRIADGAKRERFYGAIAVLVGAFALWGVGQVALGPVRGHAPFTTNNTLAAVVNLLLAPAAVAIAYGIRNRALDLLTATLFAGLCASSSRGGALAFVGAVTVTLVVGGAVGVRREHIGRLMMLLAVGGGLAALALAASHWLPRLVTDSPFGYWSLDSTRSRLELWRLAWSTTTLGWGIGYLAFRYVLQVGSAEVTSYGAGSYTYFVHNDYLQALLEVGVPGLVALLAIVALALRAGMSLRGSITADRAEGLALLAGILTVAAHAVLDFPLHVPLCLLLFGASLGMIDRLTSPNRPSAPAGQPQRLITLVLVMGVTVLLARAVIAEGAATYAIKKWLLGETRAAAFGFELARRADPRDWRYDLYAGQFWFAQAAETRQAEHARFTDSAFAAGMVANPLEPSCYLGRAFANLRFASLLPAPASPTVIRQWADQALRLAPLNAAVRKEYDEIVRNLPAKR